RAALVAVLTLVALYAFGAWRVSGPADATVAGVKLRLMQPDLTQDTAFVAANGDRILADYLKLSDRATSPTTSGIADATHLIWPESPFPFVLKDRPAATARIGAALAGRTILVTGAVRRGAFRSGDSAPRFFNAMQVVAADGAVVDSYDKVHLVPFGEYLPMAALLKRLGLTQMISVPGGFSAGSERRLLNVPGLPPVAPLICYEAIFPGAVVPPGPRPGLLLNVTDDAWFGDTPGPWQHFAQARLRAIEEGLPLVRDANTGVSAIVDGRGRITGLLGVGAKDVLDGGLPVAEAQTPFSRFGNLAAFALILSALVFATIGKFRN
ncbi:MAG: apolipoprotein N-acyltransferase, partial [Hyphomicrobiales bacterium]|nr:apolipoprotein N-acyltransferase [Hyphomicrobiales bacterium]